MDADLKSVVHYYLAAMRRHSEARYSGPGTINTCEE